MISPDVQQSEIVGFVAGLGTTFAALPDLIKMLRRQSRQGVSPTMPAILGIFQIVWIYYGFLVASRPLVWWNVIAVLINSLCVTAYFLFARREKMSE